MPVELSPQTYERVMRNKALLDRVTLVQSMIALERARAARPDIWSDPNPLISVRICTYARPKELVERAIASVLNQTYQNFEVIVVGDHAGPETAEAMAKIDDPRVHYHNLPFRHPYPQARRFFWYSAGAYPAIEAVARAKGDWMCFLDDDDEYKPDHFEVLLRTALDNQLEMVYGVSEYQKADGDWFLLGDWPLRHGGICSGSALFHRRFFGVPIDPFCWMLDEPGDWNFWKRIVLLGGRIGRVPNVVYRHYQEYSAKGLEAQSEITRQFSPQEFLHELHLAGGDHMLAMG